MGSLCFVRSFGLGGRRFGTCPLWSRPPSLIRVCFLCYHPHSYEIFWSYGLFRLRLRWVFLTISAHHVISFLGGLILPRVLPQSVVFTSFSGKQKLYNTTVETLNFLTVRGLYGVYPFGGYGVYLFPLFPKERVYTIAFFALRPWGRASDRVSATMVVHAFFYLVSSW